MTLNRSYIRQITPMWLGSLMRMLWCYAKNRLQSLKTCERVFTEIYQKNLWGGRPGEVCSGGGSSDRVVVCAYLDMLKSHSSRIRFHELVFVDLGCGDMTIGRQLIPLCKAYVGADIVKFLVQQHRSEFVAEKVRFEHLDMIEDLLPKGDVCFVRQVMQHLSNRQILGILPKLKKYKYVYLTEHVPSDKSNSVANCDKKHGSGIRLDYNSGVDITKPPFNIPREEVGVVLDVGGNSSGNQGNSGVIRTVLYTPGRPFDVSKVEKSIVDEEQ